MRFIEAVQKLHENSYIAIKSDSDDDHITIYMDGNPKRIGATLYYSLCPEDNRKSYEIIQALEVLDKYSWELVEYD